LAWSDEFNGDAGAQPDPAIWTPMLGGTGWGNHELECYTSSRDNSFLDGSGDLVIAALKPTGGTRCSDNPHNAYTSARLSTEGLQASEYGRIEVRAELPTGVGIWPAIWALGTDHDVVTWPASGELDVAEVIGWAPTVVHGTVHGPTRKQSPYKLTGMVNSPSSLSTEFHSYSVDWDADSIAFAFDGTTYARFTRSAVAAQGAWVFDQPFYVLLDVAVGGDWPGSPDSTTVWPQQLIVDYVRVYEN
jgi:beta-glucanase (GH16 family)